MGIQLGNKALDVRLSAAARRALEQRARPLLAELELVFGCMVRKQVRFADLAGDDDVNGAVPVSDQLSVRFRSTLSQGCLLDGNPAAAEDADARIIDQLPFAPGWLRIDYRRGEWRGEFGY